MGALLAPGEAAEKPPPTALQRVLATPADTCSAAHLDRRRLVRFYPGHSPALLWVADAAPLPRAGRLRAVLERSEDEGLPPARYALEAVTARWEARTPTDRACLDVLLTTAFERYGQDLATGIVSPRDADRTWHLPRAAAFDAVAVARRCWRRSCRPGREPGSFRLAACLY